MNRILCRTLIVATAILASCCNIAGLAQPSGSNVFEWSARPQLTADQQEILGLQKSSEICGEDSPLRAQHRAELAALQKKLGPLSVRFARPQELIMSRLSTNVCSIHNPTDERLVLTVAIVGDVERLG